MFYKVLKMVDNTELMGSSDYYISAIRTSNIRNIGLYTVTPPEVLAPPLRLTPRARQFNSIHALFTCSPKILLFITL